MKEKCGVIVTTLLALFFVTIGGVVSAQTEDLNELAQKMAEIDEIEAGDTYKAKVLTTNEKDTNINKRFDKLSIDEKLKVISLSRQLVSDEEHAAITTDTSKSVEIIDKAAQLAAKDGVFFGDLSDEEMNKYVEAVKEDLTDEELNEYSESVNKELTDEEMNEYNETEEAEKKDLTDDVTLKNFPESTCDENLSTNLEEMAIFT